MLQVTQNWRLLGLRQYGAQLARRWQGTTATQESTSVDSTFMHDSFDELWRKRSAEAARSIVVELESEQVSPAAYRYCQQFGTIQNAFSYHHKSQRQFILLEFDNEQAIDRVYAHSTFRTDATPWPNQFLKLHSSKLPATMGEPVAAPIRPSVVRRSPVAAILQSAETVEQQILLFYKHLSINDVSIRLKFLASRLAQRILNQFLGDEFPRAIIYPFGSSLSGFGTLGCDLDMALKFRNRDFGGTPHASQPFQFYGKEVEVDGTAKAFEGRQVKYIAAMFDHYLPGSSRVESFHNARVPIVRYFDTNVHCSADISANNPSGFHATELMYVYGVLDPRVRPLIFLIRGWAREFGITKFYPKDTFTNFHLSYMALHFLIHCQVPVLPTLEEMHPQRSDDSPFLFDIDRIAFKTANTDSILALFKQFLEYYATFDMKNNLVTVRTREPCPRNEPVPVHLENVFDPPSPWGINVGTDEWKTMQIMIRETLAELALCRTSRAGDERWGLLELLTQVE